MNIKNNKTMRKLMIIILMIISISATSQIMQIVPATDTTADFTIVVVNNELDSDITVMKVKTKAQSSRTRETSNNVYWKMIPMDKSKRHDFKIKIVATGSKHDLKVYFTTNPSVARMKSECLRYGLTHYVTTKKMKKNEK